MEKIVLEAYSELLEEKGLSDFEVNLDVKLGRNSGLDSLGIVNLILILEEKMDITLDQVLANIRKSKDLREIVGILESIKS